MSFKYKTNYNMFHTLNMGDTETEINYIKCGKETLKSLPEINSLLHVGWNASSWMWCSVLSQIFTVSGSSQGILLQESMFIKFI